MAKRRRRRRGGEGEGLKGQLWGGTRRVITIITGQLGDEALSRRSLVLSFALIALLLPFSLPIHPCPSPPSLLCLYVPSEPSASVL